MKSTCHNSPIVHYNNGNYCSTCFTEQFEQKNFTWVLYLVFSIVLMMGVYPVKAPTLTKITGTYNLRNIIPGDIVPSDSAVLKELVKDKCVLASVGVAQARIESANYTSDIAVNNRNLFGIKVHTCPYVTGERKGHATFATYKDNIACYCKIQHKYLGKIDKSYAEDSSYCKIIKQMK